MGYASHTGTLRNLAALEKAGWGVVVSPFGRTFKVKGRMMLDNPAWPVSQMFVKGTRPTREPTTEDLAKFEQLLDALGPRADLIIVPDIVMGGERSLGLSAEWLPVLRRRVPAGPKLLVAVQDGMEDGRLARRARQLIDQADGIFVGGGDPWKEEKLPVWAAHKRATGCHLHVGRVNTVRRIALCAAADADSFDGSSATMFAKTLPRLEQAARQPALIGFGVGARP